MRHDEEGPRKEGPPGPAKDTPTVAEPLRVAPQDDIWAWCGIHLADGRVISIAWLRGYPGAVASPPRAGAR